MSIKNLNNLLIILLLSFIFFIPSLLNADTTNPLSFSGKITNSIACSGNSPVTWLVTVDESESKGGTFMYVSQSTAPSGTLSTKLDVGSAEPKPENNPKGKSVLGTYTTKYLACLPYSESGSPVMTTYGDNTSLSKTPSSPATNAPSTATATMPLDAKPADVTTGGLTPTDATTPASGSAGPNGPSGQMAKFDSNMGLGSRGDNVKELQQFLNDQTGADLTVDGVFGPLTQGALAAFQSANGIYPAKGYFGPVSRAAANNINGYPSTSSGPTVNQQSARRPISTKSASDGKSVTNGPSSTNLNDYLAHGRYPATDHDGEKGTINPLVKYYKDNSQRLFGVDTISDYRGPKHNAAVGGATHSDHLTGDALDIDVGKGGWSAKNNRANWIVAYFKNHPEAQARKIIWNQIIYQPNGRGGWSAGGAHDHTDHVHISFVHH